jgi:hypothetical protein
MRWGSLAEPCHSLVTSASPNTVIQFMLLVNTNVFKRENI